MKRYTMFRESAEISAAAFRQHHGDIISALFEKDRGDGDGWEVNDEYTEFAKIKEA